MFEHTMERDVRIVGTDHAGQQREGAVFQLHHHALQRLLRAFDRHFQQLQDHRLVLAQHLARGNAEQQGITDLAGCAGDGDANGFLAHRGLLEEGRKRRWEGRENANSRFANWPVAASLM